jgi:predicted Fe-Mo cluster-binding NifX family protein
MNKKIAIPMENGKLCTHFGHCEYFAIASIEDGHVAGMEEQTPPAHEPGVYPRWIASLGVTDVIAGGMGQKAIELFNQQGINAFVGCPANGANEILEDFLAGKLVLSANYCNHDGKQEHHCHH